MMGVEWKRVTIRESELLMLLLAQEIVLNFEWQEDKWQWRDTMKPEWSWLIYLLFNFPNMIVKFLGKVK